MSVDDSGDQVHECLPLECVFRVHDYPLQQTLEERGFVRHRKRDLLYVSILVLQETSQTHLLVQCHHDGREQYEQILLSGGCTRLRGLHHQPMRLPAGMGRDSPPRD